MAFAIAFFTSLNLIKLTTPYKTAQYYGYILLNIDYNNITTARHIDKSIITT